MNTKQKQQKQQKAKEVYKKPTIEIIEMEVEGSILAGSGGDYNPGGGWGN